jgi:intein/homing endonuclease
MSLKALSDYTVYSRYAQYLREEKRRETWEEAVTRVFDMHRKKYEKELSTSEELHKELEFAEIQVKKKRVLGSQRALQYGGEPILKRNERMFNCSSLLIDKPFSFQQVVWLLLAGAGVGFSVQKHHIQKLPKIVKKKDNAKSKKFKIPDTCEGWADAVGVLLSSYFENGGMFPEYKGTHVEFDFSEIRPKGSLIAGKFKAPGPEPLKNGLNRIKNLLDRQFFNSDKIDESTIDLFKRLAGDEVAAILVEKNRKKLENDDLDRDKIKLEPIVAYDILMHASDFVISGGLRRCLPEGNKVFMQDGVKNIEDVTKGEIVLTPNGYQKVLNNFYQGSQKTIKIITEDGYFECTPNHKMPVLTSLDEYKWVKAEDLKPEDRIITNSTPIDGKETKLPEYTYENPPHSTTCTDIMIPELDNDMAWLLGHIAGDGYVQYNPDRNRTDKTSNNCVSVVTHEKDLSIAQKVQQQLERFGVSTRLKKRDNENSYMVSATSKQLSEYFYTHIKKPNENIHIPQFIWDATTDVKLAYVSGLADADGALNNKPVIICSSVYFNFIKDIQTLLYSCGINSRLSNADTTKWKSRKNWQQIYTLSLISKSDKDRFLNNNNSIIKEMKIGKISRMANSFPSEFITESDKFANKSKMGAFSNKNVTVDCVSRHGFIPNLNPVKVLGIEEGNLCETYDIEVENEHQFYCNGYLTHNSATICLFSPEDNEMMTAKTGNWFNDNPQRGRSNNSVVLKRSDVKKDEFKEIFESIKQAGEPGFFFVTDDFATTTNPCCEISFWPILPNGESGVNVCNLTEINGKFCTDEEKFLQACRASAIIGTLQAGYNEFPYLGKTTEEIVRYEALLGCSITGWMDNPDILFNAKLLEKGAKEIKRVNEKIAQIIGINPAARLTCSKPAGSTSCVLKTASGIHPHHARRYIRRTQANKQEFPLQHFKKHNPNAVEESVWSANGTDEVISFLCEVPNGAITKNQVNAIELLQSVKKAQKHWVLAGNVPERALNETVSHNVSNTITVMDDEWDEVCEYIYENRDYFTGISLLPASGDLDYPQAPFSTVLTPSELIKEYGDASVFASGLVVDGLHAFDNNLWEACNSVLGMGTKLDQVKESPSYPKEENNKALAQYFLDKEEYDKWFAKVDWIRRANQFANRYFNGDVRKMTYCLKHVSLWKTWCDLKREYKEIDWSNVVEEDETFVNADTLASQACVGTKGCDI